jgi:hypothetical protein
VLSVVAAVVVVAVVVAVYVATRPPPSEPWTLPIPAGTVLAFNPNVQGITVVPSNVTNVPTEYIRLFSFTVSQPTATVVGAWSFTPATTQVYAGVVRSNLAAWGGMLSQVSASPLRANVTAGDNILGIIAWGPGNLTVTQTIQFY